MNKSLLNRKDYEQEIKTPASVVTVGSSKIDATKVQEWLCLHKYHTVGYNVKITIDGDFGPATASAVREFQRLNKIEPTGIVDANTWLALIAPMQRAFRVISDSVPKDIKSRLIAYANQFVVEHPTELGQNSGPWVRAFMKSQSGDWAAWCNGTVSTILDNAAASIDSKMDVWLPWSWSCANTKENAVSGKYKAKYLSPVELEKKCDIGAGDLFLVEKPNGHAEHIGIVENFKDGVIYTIEGNTNDEGSREGYELCKRRRTLSKKNIGIIKLL